MLWSQLRDVARADDLTAEQKRAVFERYRQELERRVQLVEALIDAVRSHDERRPDGGGEFL
jgi:hypothetical protein